MDAEAEGIDDDAAEEAFPEIVLDAVLGIIAPVWGTAHVRRAIEEQCALVISGETAPAFFAEPARWLEYSGDRKVAKDPAVPASAAPDCPAPLRPAGTASATARVEADWERGRGAWAVLIRFTEDRREEERFLSGIVEDPNGKRVWTAAAGELADAAEGRCAPGKLTLVVPEQGLRQAILDEPGVRAPAEEGVWKRIDALLEGAASPVRESGVVVSWEQDDRCAVRVSQLLNDH